MRIPFINDLKIRYKIMLVPVPAAIAFFLIILVNTYMVSRNTELLASIDQQYFPALEMSRELDAILMNIQNNMQYAASAKDEEILQSTDQMRSEFLSLIKNN